MEREELIRSKEYWTVQLQAQLFEVVEDYLRKHRLTQSQLAQEWGVSKGYISQVLNGNFDHKISKFVEILLACGKAPVLRAENIEDFVQNDLYQFKYTRDNTLSITAGNRPIAQSTAIHFTRYMSGNATVRYNA